MNDERPNDEGTMFFVGMKFNPDSKLTQSDLNRIVVHLFSKLFTTFDGEPIKITEHESAMLTLVQFIVNLDMRLSEEIFAGIPTELRKHFKVIHRDGVEYQYGHRPRL